MALICSEVTWSLLWIIVTLIRTTLVYLVFVQRALMSDIILIFLLFRSWHGIAVLHWYGYHCKSLPFLVLRDSAP